MRAALPGALTALNADGDVRVVVATGAGEAAFMSGADISEFAAQRTAPADRAAFDRGQAALAQAWARLDKPVIAMIRGYCLGGGPQTSAARSLSWPMRAIRSLIRVPPTAAKVLPVWRRSWLCRHNHERATAGRDLPRADGRVLPVRLAGRKLATALLERHRLFVSCMLRRVATLIMRCQ
jgi:hypothetical protein